jgi:hypothetical protein
MPPDNRKVTVNRAMVLTLWAALAAERLGANQSHCLSLVRVPTPTDMVNGPPP